MNPSNTSPLLRGLLSRPSTSSAPPPPLEPLPSTSSASEPPAPPTIEEDPPVVHLSDDEEWESTLISTAFPNFWDPELRHLVIEEVLGTTEYRCLRDLTAPPPSLPEQDLTPAAAEDIPSLFLPSPPPVSLSSPPSPPSPPSLPSLPPPATDEETPWREFILEHELPPLPPSPSASPPGAPLPRSPFSHLPSTTLQSWPQVKITRRQLSFNVNHQVWRWERTGGYITVFLIDIHTERILKLSLPRSFRPTKQQKLHHLFDSSLYLVKRKINGRILITFNP